MSLEDLGNIGEFLAAIGVIVSLIYLAMQIRQNTRSVRASTFHESSSRAGDLMRAIAEQKELARILHTGLGAPDQIEDDVDRLRFGMLLSAVFRGYEDLFFQYRAGTLSSESWDAWRNSLRNILGNPGFPPFWGIRRLSFSESFRQFVEAERETGEPLPTFAEAVEMMKRAAEQPAAPGRQQGTDD
jgi:hypothetical protein